MLGKVGC